MIRLPFNEGSIKKIRAEWRRSGLNPGTETCCICGKAVPDPQHVIRLWCGQYVVTNNEADNLIEEGYKHLDSGFHVIGRGCSVYYAKQLKPYLMSYAVMKDSVDFLLSVR